MRRAAGVCRVGGAHVSELHCNFLINEGDATAADIETLGETYASGACDNSGVVLEWEIKRIGVHHRRRVDDSAKGRRVTGPCVSDRKSSQTSLSSVTQCDEFTKYVGCR